jgi:hypothetical protein
MTQDNSARRGPSPLRLGATVGAASLRPVGFRGQVGKAAPAQIRVANTDGRLGWVPSRVRLNPSHVYRRVEPRGCVPAVGLSPGVVCPGDSPRPGVARFPSELVGPRVRGGRWCGCWALAHGPGSYRTQVPKPPHRSARAANRYRNILYRSFYNIVYDIWILATYDIVGHLRYRRSVTTTS